MVKIRAKAKAKMQAQSKPKQKIVAVRGAKTEATDYLRLLADPCNAKLTHPPFIGTGSGYLVRTKQRVLPSGSTGAVDFFMDIHPGGILNSSSGAVFGTWGYSTTVGGALGTAQAIQFPTFIGNNTIGYFRAVAGCAKVWYSGSEMERKGLIGLALDQGSVAEPGATYAGVAPDAIQMCQRVARLGTEAHEVRWVPNSEDQAFIGNAEPTSAGSVNQKGTTIRLVGTGLPAGSCSVEITFVWEWVPLQVGVVPNPSVPPRYTLNDVLSKIGSVARFATDPATMRTFANFARGVYNAASQLSPALAITAM
nr:MAG: hypothetical protein 3 [Tombusviridae sp.]